MELLNGFAKLFADPPAEYRGLENIHFFRHRRSFREIWHFRPADPSRNLRNLGPAHEQNQLIWFGAHPELDPDLGIRGDLRCMLGALQCVTSDADLDELVKGKTGGFAVNVAWSPEYPYDARDWQDFRAGLDYCRNHGIEAWIYDEAGYPSGHANQRVFDGHPEYVAKALYWTAQSVAGAGQVTITPPEGHCVAIVAVAEVPDGLDGQQQVLGDAASLSVCLPSGQWRVWAFSEREARESTHADYLNIRYPNLLDGSAVRRFLDLTHEVYFRQCAEWFGSTIKAIFTDEPSLMAGCCAMPTGVDRRLHVNLPWVADLPEVFAERTGYPLAEALPALIADVGPVTRKRRCDFWETIAHLLATRCYRQIGDWCKSHGLAYSGHLLWEEQIRHHVVLHGDMMECLRHFGWPGYDALGSPLREESPQGFAYRMMGAKYVSSAAHLYGKPHAMCETFGLTPPRPVEVYEHVLDTLVLLGLDKHGFYSLFDKMTPAEHARLNIHLGRVALAGTYGRHRCDIAVLYPIVAAWAGHNAAVPQDQTIPLDEALSELTQGLLDRQLDFDFCDDRSLQEGQAAGGRWRVADASYRVLLVPPMDTMRRSTLEALDRAQQAGVRVLFADAFPTATREQGPDDSLAAWCAERFPSPTPVGAAADEACRQIAARPRLNPVSSALWICHRRARHRSDEWRDVFLVVNTASANYEGELCLPVEGKPCLCDVGTGEIRPVDVITQSRRATTVRLSVPGLGIRVVAFA